MTQSSPHPELPNPPPLLPFNGSDWGAYVESLYLAFCSDFCTPPGVIFQGQRVTAPRLPVDQGKHASFWHVISDGPIEKDRIPNPRRCERVPWIGWLIRHAESDPRISWWENERTTKRGPEKRVLILYAEQRFVVVLGPRVNKATNSAYIVLISAYFIESDRRLEALLAERAAWRQAQGHPNKS